MKLSPRDAAAFLARPDPGVAAALIYGPAPMRVALKRQDLTRAIVGPQGEAEMRLTRLTGADVRRDPAALMDAVKATGFFPGPRCVLVDEAGDGLAEAAAAVLAGWRDGDARIVVAAGQLSPGSKLRKLFETAKTAVAIAVYDDPPGRDEIEGWLREAACPPLDRAAMDDLLALARALDPGEMRQTVERLALYTRGQAAPVSAADVAAVAPASVEAETDDLIDAVADGRPDDLAGLLSRLAAQGVTPVALCISATRHFRALLVAKADPAGPDAALSRARPPLNFRRKDALLRQVRRWDAAALDRALALLVDTDLQLRSSSRAPGMALVERALIRLAVVGRGR
ncbi:MAG: DNA polymerase III subunit delta [Rhodobacteraceae bacterium]|jgi:DNA polymerase-3 subunit delta|nr:DNA polymerase III subunit delta [Paracoccaceae bacterium]